MFISHRHLPALAVMLLAAPLAHAHPLADHSLAWQAFVHPFSGADYVFAMLVIGLWAGLAAPARRLLPPLAFMGGLLGGAALGAGKAGKRRRRGRGGLRGRARAAAGGRGAARAG